MANAGSRPSSRHCSSNDSDAVRPDYSLLAAHEQAKLYRIVHEILLAYCGSWAKVSAVPMMSIYERLLGWRKNLPVEIRDADSEDEALPHLLFLQ